MSMSAMLTTPKDTFNSEVNGISDVIETSEALSYLYSQVTRTRSLTAADRQLIRSVLLQEQIHEEESRIINRILYSVRRGWIKLVEEMQYSPTSGGSGRSFQILGSVA